MKVWIVWDEVPYEGKALIAVCTSLERAEQIAERYRSKLFIEIESYVMDTDVLV